MATGCCGYDKIPPYPIILYSQSGVPERVKGTQFYTVSVTILWPASLIRMIIFSDLGRGDVFMISVYI